jgi:hypothetical protein
MIVFYLAGSRVSSLYSLLGRRVSNRRSFKVTKTGHSIKKTLSEEGGEEAGYRNVWQASASFRRLSTQE